MKKRFAVILAAGQGTRMKSALCKVLHPILGRPIIEYILESLHANAVDKKVTVVGHGSDSVIKALEGKSDFFVKQEEQLGTAHAVLQASSVIKDEVGTTIVVAGDTPLIKPETFEKLIQHHESTGSTATIMTSYMDNPFGYGRIIRNDAGHVEKIVEQKDASATEQEVNEINTATYCFDNQALFSALKKVGNDNNQGEYYLTDLIEIFNNENKKVSAYVVEDSEETLGINTRVELVHAEKLMKKRINEGHLLNGVTITDPDNTYIGSNVTIEQDVLIYPGSIITGETHIATGTIIGPNTEINSCDIGEDSVIRQSVLEDSKIGREADIGPFAYVRPDNVVGDCVKVGNFVELKNTTVGDHTKIAHLNYVGDAHLGSGINVGCGAITVNFDGKNKHITTIEDDAFIGCNVNLVAPVTVEKGAFVAAGSTINKDVPKEALAIARNKQTNKEGYVTRMKHNQEKS